MPAIETFSKFGFFSKAIDLSTIYPAGYPFFMSIAPRLSSEHWVIIAQVIQGALFTMTSYIIFCLAKRLFSRELSLLLAGLISFYPAWIVASSEAMYETLFLFFFTLGTLLFIKVGFESQKYSILYTYLCGGILGFVNCIHPRLLPITLGMVFILIIRTSHIYSRLITALFFVIPQILFVAREYIVNSRISLGGDPWAASWIGRDGMKLCSSIICYLGEIKDSPMPALTHYLYNFVCFWSPFSGPLKRGTWMHNISLPYQVYKYGYLEVSIVLSAIITLITTILLVYGIRHFFTINRSVTLSAISLLFILSITDVVIYGDSRHRLIAIPITLFFEIYAVSVIHQKKFSQSRLSAGSVPF
jgi:4-amino-4-deoxy-L-arabinose transferase-like glycosyltransferase